MSAGLIEQMTVGLFCTGQELFPWEGPYLIDCISVLSRTSQGCVRMKNRGFFRQVRQAAAISRVYR
jgi:hypothetical protein